MIDLIMMLKQENLDLKLLNESKQKAKTQRKSKKTLRKNKKVNNDQQMNESCKEILREYLIQEIDGFANQLSDENKKKKHFWDTFAKKSGNTNFSLNKKSNQFTNISKEANRRKKAAKKKENDAKQVKNKKSCSSMEKTIISNSAINSIQFYQYHKDFKKLRKSILKRLVKFRNKIAQEVYSIFCKSVNKYDTKKTNSFLLFDSILNKYLHQRREMLGASLEFYVTTHEIIYQTSKSNYIYNWF